MVHDDITEEFFQKIILSWLIGLSNATLQLSVFSHLYNQQDEIK